MNNNIYNMKLHDEITLASNHLTIIRVPGGWIYVNLYLDISIFVPFNYEFHVVKEEVKPDPSGFIQGKFYLHKNDKDFYCYCGDAYRR